MKLPMKSNEIKLDVKRLMRGWHFCMEIVDEKKIIQRNMNKN
jgi:hypothetical protein